ncbi:energy-coupling factor transporter transmembrane component T family protein [Geopsychrobacter electrodiphilus]|uniref:energy-coupling factor transporter transmembrane component T family protein n=1 Tax=Geopsychrobacter electrodiphilus TaxID=225196 RepID=UPI0003806451|nr:energy-coupling factor transporter transmembrane component T [Geopsychrobacter electrodiphilus]
MSGTSLLFQQLRRKQPKSPPRLSAGVALGLCFFLSLGAILTQDPVALGCLSVANLALLFVHRLDRQVLVRGGRVCLWQGGMVTALYVLRYGMAQGLMPGLRISWQLLLVFLPGLILLSGDSGSRMLNALGKILPARSAFVLTTSLKFLPLLLTEISAIYEAQRLRGARIRPRDQLWPGHWGDLLHCLVAPVVVRALEIADNISCAARTREFGRFPRRTCWPDDQET